MSKVGARMTILERVKRIEKKKVVLGKLRQYLVLVLLLLLVIAGCTAKSGLKPRAPTQRIVRAIFSKTAPKIDGRGDDPVWQKAKTTTILMSDKSKVFMKAVYTDNRIYFLLKWKDLTPDTGVKYWEFDGKKWHIDLGGDMVGMLWNISIKEFEKKGCQSICHYFENDGQFHMRIVGKNLAGGAPYPGYKQRADVWKWTPGLMNRLYRVDDGLFVADQAYLLYPRSFKYVTLAIRFERGGDSGTMPEWFRNENANEEDEENPLPSLKLKEGLTIENKPFPDQRDMEEITDYSVFKAGDKIPHFYYLNPKDPANKDLYPHGKAEGSRVDIKGYATWENGEWALEIERKLNTGHGLEDVQFRPDKRVYYPFTLAIFNDLREKDFASHAKSEVLFLELEAK